MERLHDHFLFPFFFFCVCVQVAGKTLPYEELWELRQRMYDISPTLVRYGELEPANFFTLAQKLVKVSLNVPPLF